MTPRPGSAGDEAGSARDIYGQLRGHILGGAFGAHEKLPTVRQMASDVGVSPGTVAKAYKLLEQDGLVVTRTAAGTRVAASAARLPASVTHRLRAVIEEAAVTGTSMEDVIDVLRSTWPSAGTPDGSR
ncbi:GntR family transcriptional regulator [Microbacterium sp. AG790]|uniref:GntR family transcriptional regulator n=1 Tax=Microbacterium sp. AG790 TaxID=2183995 RepID=UPI000EB57406|nr:GntR family transcriptional regulator [Microbacterium sp. AG790]RKS92781.1 GntR family transcriptional regulator [Microbacterium sp. AG790]